ncbi:MAG: hypothetical protein ACYCO0_01985 [Candidatus Micrarchaeaceae archaeon]
MATSTVTVTRTELKSIQKELEIMEIEIMRLKALLVPTAKLSRKEKKELESIQKDMAKGHWISGRDLIKKLG